MTVESGVPKPKKRRQVAYITAYGIEFNLAERLENLHPDQCFTVDTFEMRRYAMKRAHDKKIKVTSEKQRDGRYKIWKL